MRTIRRASLIRATSLGTFLAALQQEMFHLCSARVLVLVGFVPRSLGRQMDRGSLFRPEGDVPSKGLQEVLEVVGHELLVPIPLPAALCPHDCRSTLISTSNFGVMSLLWL